MSFTSTTKNKTWNCMPGHLEQIALVMALALCMALHLGCGDSQPEVSPSPMVREVSIPSPVAQPSAASTQPTPTAAPPSPFAAQVAPLPVSPPETPPIPVANRIEPSATPSPEAPASPSSTAPEAPSTTFPDWSLPYDGNFGQSLLKERINRSDIVARVRLLSAESAVAHFEYTGREDYAPSIKYTFQALEYLRGSGDSELVAVAPTSTHLYISTESKALAIAPQVLAERDTQWDSREAIVFLKETQRLTNYPLIFVHMIALAAYTIDNPYNKTWLPAATPQGAAGSSGQTAGEMRFLLDAPDSGASGASGQSQPPTITLSELRSQVKTENEILKAGEAVHGREAYRKCLAEKYRDERMAESGNMKYTRKDIGPVDSGLPAGTRIGDPDRWGRTPRDLPGDRIEDNDAHLFNHKPLKFHIKRPLPSGEYRFYRNFWSPADADYTICGADVLPEEIRTAIEVFVNVVAPAGTLHEAFFDPALDTSASAVGAGGEDGVLKPASFTFEGVGAVTIERIEWGADSVRMELSPHGRLTGHHVDFIEMDGSVGLSLDFADAVATTTDDGSNALSWSVAESPWADGDTLMLRIYRIVPEFIDAPYAFSLNEDVGLGHAVGDVSATSTLGLALSYSIIGGNTPSRFSIDALTGSITTTEFLDYETTPSYRLAISAAGSDGGIATTTADITVADVSDEPPPTPPDFSVQEVSGGFDMSWRAVPNTLLYSVYWKANRPGEQFAILSTTDAVIELRPEGGALCDQEYEFRLSVHGDGVSYESSWSGWVSVSVTTAVCAG